MADLFEQISDAYNDKMIKWFFKRLIMIKRISTFIVSTLILIILIFKIPVPNNSKYILTFIVFVIAFLEYVFLTLIDGYDEYKKRKASRNAWTTSKSLIFYLSDKVYSSIRNDSSMLIFQLQTIIHNISPFEYIIDSIQYMEVKVNDIRLCDKYDDRDIKNIKIIKANNAVSNPCPVQIRMSESEHSRINNMPVERYAQVSIKVSIKARIRDVRHVQQYDELVTVLNFVAVNEDYDKNMKGK